MFSSLSWSWSWWWWCLLSFRCFFIGSWSSWSSRDRRDGGIRPKSIGLGNTDVNSISLGKGSFTAGGTLRLKCVFTSLAAIGISRSSRFNVYLRRLTGSLSFCDSVIIVFPSKSILE